MTLLTKVLGGCCACLFYFATLSLSAQEAVSDTITGKVHQIDKVTVTARKLPNKITSAVPIQTLSQQDISQLGIQNMADAVRRFAGANVKGLRRDRWFENSFYPQYGSGAYGCQL